MTSGTSRLYAASYVVLRDNGKVLLARRHRTGWRDGWWSLPAGHVEWGESCEQAAIREVAEEVGVGIDPADLAPLCAVHRTEATGKPVDERIDLFYLADRWSGTPRILEPDRCDAIGWYDPTGRDPHDRLPEPVVSPVDRVLAALASPDGVPAILVAGFDGHGDPASPRR